MVEIIGDKEVLRSLASGAQGSARRVYVLVVPSGAKAGYVSAVALKVLAEHGVTSGQFRVVVATSAGFLNVMGYCAQQSAVTPDVYLHLADKPWFFPVGLRGGWTTFHEYLLGILRGEVLAGVKLDLDALWACPSRKVAAVSDLSGGIHYHELGAREDVFRFMHATSAIVPFTFGERIADYVAIDGAYAHAHCQFARIVRALMREEPAAEICVLFVGNRPSVRHQHWLEAWSYGLGMTASLWWSPALLTSALAIDGKVERSERLFARPVRRRIRLCAILPSVAEKVDPWEWRNAHMERQGASIARSLSHAIQAL